MTKASHEAIEIVKTVIQTRMVRVWLSIVSRRLLKILFIQNSVGRSNSCCTTNFTYSGGRYSCYHRDIRTRSLLGCVTLVGGYQDYLFLKNDVKSTILTIKIRFYMLEIVLHQILFFHNFLVVLCLHGFTPDQQ